MICSAYVDASGKNNESIIAVAAVIAEVRKWKRFEQKWRQQLATEKLTHFHATDFASSKGDFRHLKGQREQRGRLYNGLVKIIKNHVKVAPLSISMETADWHSVNNEYELEEKYSSPYAICAYALIDIGQAWAKAKGDSARIKSFVEDGDDDISGLIQICKRDGLDAPIPKPKAEAIPCQAADLIAWKSMNATRNLIRNATLIEGEDDPELLLRLESESERELESLNRAVLPDKEEPRSYSRENLVNICIKHKIPRRQS